MKLPCVLITGATSGIGLALAERLAKKGHPLVLTGRRGDRLDQFAKKFPGQITPLVFDLSKRNAMEKTFAAHRELLESVSILVNNAGLAKGLGPLDQGSLDDWDVVIDTNIKGLLYFTRLLLPSLKKRSDAQIINLGSVAGRWVYPQGAVYCATKFAVRALSEGMRMDLQGSGIRISNIEPGRVKTEFSLVRLGDAKKAAEVYERTRSLEADDIAETIEWVLTRPAHVNIQELVIFPTDQASVRDMVYRDDA